MRMTALKKVLARAHMEIRRGSPAEAEKYCKKDGQWVEFGTPLKQGERSDLTEVAAMVRDGASLAEIDAVAPGLAVQYHRGLEAMRLRQMKDRTEAPQVVWLWGLTGTGKTRTAVEGAASFYMKDGTKWWDGYEQQERIVIDDFDGAWPFRDLLRLLDRYPYQGQYKGGYVKINSSMIYITCEFPPSHWWDGSKLAQIERRLTTVTEVLGT